MLESNFKKQIYQSIKHYFPKSFIQKIADKYTPGIPDMIIIIGGSVTFVELKCTKCRQDGGFKIDTLFTQEQVVTARLITMAQGNWLGFIHLDKLGMVVIGWDILSKDREIYLGNTSIRFLKNSVPLIKPEHGFFDLRDLGFYHLLNNGGWKE